jgi:carbon monoxide dehydrogenase subunit G
MQLQGTRHMAAPPAQVWAALNDAAVLQRCIPGCESVEDVSDRERRARVALKLGPVRARFDGRVLLSDVRPRESCTLAFEGSGGAAGFARGQSQVTLTPEGAGTTVGYTVEASVGGKLGQVGGRLIESAARGLADEFFDAMAREWAPAEAAAETNPAAPAAVEPAAAPSPATAPVPDLERLRVTWFLLGVAATTFGVLLARWLF